MTDKSSQSIPIRRSFRLGAWEITLIGLGVWLAIGVLEQELQSWGAVEIADLKIRHELQEVEVLGTLYSRDPITEDQLNQLQREQDAQLRPDGSLRLIVIPAELLESGTP